MLRPYAIATLAFTMGLAWWANLAAISAAEAVGVQLTSGRTFTGEISPRSDDQQLWLVQRAGTAEITRRIAWENIVAADFRQQPLTGRQLHRLIVWEAAPRVAAASAAQTNGEPPSDPFADDPVGDEELPTPTRDEPKPVNDANVSRLEFSPPPVASVRFDAHIANWDADVEADGLVVQVAPVDRYGQVVPLRATLQVELFGVRRVAFQDAPTKRGRSYDRLGLWTQQVIPEMIHADGGWFKLPFQSAQPEFDSRIGLTGLVHVKLAAPGAGVFEASLDGVRLRPFAPLRDAMERASGHRFFPTETTKLGKRTW